MERRIKAGSCEPKGSASLAVPVRTVKPGGDASGSRQPLRPLRLARYAWLVAACWTALVAVLLALHVREQRCEVIEAARIMARENFDKDVLYRRWNAQYGGVYVPVDENTPPNEYLDVPERDITTLSGRKLTLINPAYMTRQVHEIGREAVRTRGHITSLKPIRPGNAPDPWEREALESFERGHPEVSAVEAVDGQPYMRLMRPLATEAGCLNCHASQGYKLGDVRGGISVAVPMAPFYAASGKTLAITVGGYALLWLAGLVGIAVGARSLARRIRRHYHAEIALAESEQNYRELFESASDVILAVGADGTILDINHRGAEVTGYPRHELIGMNVLSDLVHPDDRAAIGRTLDRLQAGEEHMYEVRWRSRDGKILHFEGNSSSRRAEDGTFLSSRCILRDVTERRRIDAELRLSEKRYRSLIHDLPIGLYRNTPGPVGKFIMANPAIAKMFGYDCVEEFLQARTCDLYVDPAKRQAFSDKLLAAGKVVAEELELRKADGTVIWGAVTANAARDAAGQITYFDGLVEDITERKAAEEALKFSEDRLRAILDNVGVGVSVVSPEMQILSLNRQMQQWFPAIDVSAKPICYASFNDPPRDEPCSYCPVVEALADGKVHTSEAVTHTAEGVRHYRIIASPITDADGRIVAVVEMVDDVTEAHSSQEQLKEMLADLEKFNRLATGRELRMVELKREVNEMARKAGAAPPYELAFAEEHAEGGQGV